MSTSIVVKDNIEFSHVINDFFGGKHLKETLSKEVWIQSNVIIVELNGEKFLRQTRYYPYDLDKSKKLNEEDYLYILENQTNILYVYEDGSYDIYNKEANLESK